MPTKFVPVGIQHQQCRITVDIELLAQGIVLLFEIVRQWRVVRKINRDLNIVLICKNLAVL